MNARAVAVCGVGYGSRSLALDGFWFSEIVDAPETTDPTGTAWTRVIVIGYCETRVLTAGDAAVLALVVGPTATLVVATGEAVESAPEVTGRGQSVTIVSAVASNREID
jgi:hypothetical protein